MIYTDTIKKEIDKLFSSSLNELLYIYDYMGNILFREKWEKEIPKVYNTNDKQYCCKLFGILTVINQILKKDEKEEMINYIFVKSVHYLESQYSSSYK